MKYINIFEEWSKNEPIKEIINKEKGLAVFLIGAPGIGKCMTYDTPVLINNELIEIGKLIEDRNIDNIDGELIIEVDDLVVNSLDDNSNIIENNVSKLYRGFSEKIVNIKTQTGVDLNITPTHPLLILDKNGDIYWKNAGEINLSDKIARPRYININDIDIDISNEMSRIIGYSLSDGSFVNNKNSKYLSLTNIDNDIINDFKYCVEKESNKILTVRSDNKYNNDVQFNDNIKKGNRYNPNRFKYDFISKIEDICGSYIFGNKSHDVEIPKIIFKNKELLKNFIGSYLGCDGSVYKNKVEFYTTSIKMATDITYSLLKFGINSFIKEKITKLNGRSFLSYIVRITSDDYNLFGEIFNNYIYCERKKIKFNNSTNSNIGSFIPNSYFIDLVYENKLIKKIRKSIGYNFTKNNNYKRVLTKKRLEKIVSLIKENNVEISLDKSLINHHNNLFFDNIIKIDIKDHNDYVYDLVLDQYHNFIGGNVPTILHNSYFVKNHINTKNPNIKDFSTDDVSLLHTGDPNVYYRGKEKPEGGMTKNASELNLSKLEKFMETGQNFIYDTTGAGKEFTDKGFEHVKEIFDKAREFNYEIVFIHLLSTLQTSLDQDKLRDRHVDPQYIKWAYAKQQGGEVDGIKVEGNIKRFKELNPDAYYIVTSIDKKYKFYKFIDGKLAVRKGDTYIVKESLTQSKRLVFFDFDDTLFHTPIKSDWMIKFGEPFERGVDWWKSPKSLDQSIFDIKTNDWTIDKYNQSKQNGDYVIMMTGRVVTLENEVKKVLDSQNLEFDEYILKPLDGVTLNYKIKTLEDKIKEFNPTEVIFYDDRRDHLPEFVKWAKEQKTNIKIVDVVTKREYSNKEGILSYNEFLTWKS